MDQPPDRDLRDRDSWTRKLVSRAFSRAHLFFSSFHLEESVRTTSPRLCRDPQCSCRTYRTTCLPVRFVHCENSYQNSRQPLILVQSGCQSNDVKSNALATIDRAEKSDVTKIQREAIGMRGSRPSVRYSSKRTYSNATLMGLKLSLNKIALRTTPPE
jgi:hypothetical protein